MIEFFTIFAGVIALVSVRLQISNRLILFWLIILPLALLDGLRWEMGTDWVNYYNYYFGETLNVSREKWARSHFDPGFVIYTDFIRSFTSNYSIYLLTTSLIIYIGIFYGVFKLTGRNFLALFYLIGTLPWYAGSLRQMLACTCFVWALNSVINRKVISYIVLMLLAISFHSTAFGFVPMYWFYGLTTLTYIIVLFIIILIAPFVDKLLPLFQKILYFYGYEKNVLLYSGGVQFHGLAPNPILGFARKIITIGGLSVFTILSKSSAKLDILMWKKIKYFFGLSFLTVIFYYIGIYKIMYVAGRLDIYTGLIATSILIGLLDQVLTKKSNRFIFYLFVLSLVGVFYYRLLWMDLFHPYSSIFYNYDLHRELH